MNVKFKMPKFGRKLTGGGMLRELLLTILATSISIVLTFGTAHLIEQHQAEQRQRQTAMMVIHDIDNSVAVLEYQADGEERQKQAFQYVIDHLDGIERLPVETLYTALTMLGSVYVNDYTFDDSKEKIFTSSQDTWKNLDDVHFVDNMESFYQSRRFLQDMLARSPLWKYPMTEEEVFAIDVKAKTSGRSLQQCYADVLKEKLGDARVRHYVDLSSYRARLLRQYAQSWKDLSDRNKFIMNIDDEELAEYVRKSQRSGRTVAKSDIIGQWEHKLSGKDTRYYDFMKGDSFSMRSINHYGNSFYSGDIVLTFHYGGKWHLSGDSLLLEFKTGKAEVDRGGITYRAEMRDSVESFVNTYFQVSRLTEQLNKALATRKDTFGVSINKAGDKIEMADGRGEDAENTTVRSFYLNRVK